MAAITFEAIREAQERLTGVIKTTTLQSSRTFSKMTGAEIYLKPECLQRAGSFKLRGGYNMVSSLRPDHRARGLVTYSSGNWAQGIALASSILGVKVTVVMPESPNMLKVAAARGYGANIVLFGKDSVELHEKARELQQEHDYVLLDPLGTPDPVAVGTRDLVAGEGTIGLEILDELPEVDAIVVPIGGGTLFVGIAMAAKALNPRVRMIGVQPQGANAMKLSLEAGRVVETESVLTVAEGLGVKRPSSLVFDLLKGLIDEMVLVSDDEIVRAMLLLMERAKLVVEPSGAAALAGVLSSRVNLTGKKVAVLLSGGNVDLQKLPAFIAAHRA